MDWEFQNHMRQREREAKDAAIILATCGVALLMFCVFMMARAVMT